jgi:hypothetical protein
LKITFELVLNLWSLNFIQRALEDEKKENSKAYRSARKIADKQERKKGNTIKFIANIYEKGKKNQQCSYKDAGEINIKGEEKKIDKQKKK